MQKAAYFLLKRYLAVIFCKKVDDLKYYNAIMLKRAIKDQS